MSEQSDLQKKLDDLIEYTQGEEFAKLDPVAQDLIVQQASAMNAYNECLKARGLVEPAAPAGRKI